jgi:dihydrofolate reductase
MLEKFRNLEISIIAAIDLNRGIGFQGHLPWPEPIKPDWENLYMVTKGCKMIMGRKSFDDVHRVWSEAGNYVLSSDIKLEIPEGFIQVNTISEALEMAKGEKEIFAIGGQKVFEETLPFATNLHLTIVKEKFKADRFFPDFDKSLFEIVSMKNFKKGNETPYEIDIVHFRRK